MSDDAQVTWGTQRADAARDPNLPRSDDPVRGAQQQDDSTHATAGVQLPGGTKIEATTDGPSGDPGTWPPPAAGTTPGTTQGGVQVTVPFGSGATKPVDTSPRAYNPDAPADPNECVGDDGRSYPDGYVIFQDNVPVKTCMRGIWVPAEPAAPASPGPGDFPSQPDPSTAVAAADPWASAASGGTDPYGSDPGGGGSAADPWGSGDTGSA